MSRHPKNDLRALAKAASRRQRIARNRDFFDKEANKINQQLRIVSPALVTGPRRGRKR